MSIRTELLSLKEEREALEKQFKELDQQLEKLSSKKEPLTKKERTLRNRTSTLAQDLLVEVKGEIGKLDQAIEEVLQKQENVKKSIEQNIKKVELKYSVPLFIDEQSSILVSNFFKYVEKNTKKLALSIKTTYCVKDVTWFRNDRYGGCEIPTGNVGIYDEKKKKFIVTSTEFFFMEDLYDITRNKYYDNLICQNTKWYDSYLEKFISKILMMIKENYPYENVFTLKIKKPYFTLELV